MNEQYVLSDNNFEKSQSDSSGVIGELNIVPMQAILQGEEIQMTTEELGNGAHGANIVWSSSNPNVIECTKDGKVKGVTKGQATITVKAKGGKAQDSITVYCAQKLSKPISTNIFSFFAWTGHKPYFFSFQHFFTRLFNPFFIGKAITVKGYYDSYFYITYQISEENCNGFIWSDFLSSNIAADEIFKQLSTYEMVIISGTSSTEKVTTKYKGNVKWTVSNDDVISFNSSTGTVYAKKPGTALVTATVGTTSKSCMVFSVSQWYEPEVTVSEKEVSVRKFPSITSDVVATLPKGASITARGDLENGWEWIYVTSGSINGFIKISDFPGIDYLMAEYHYYDEGFDVRYESAKSKIYDYAEVMNDVMMDNFNLKVCSYVEAYTSAADRCKTLTYGCVYQNNLYVACPKTGEHSLTSCLHYSELREKMLKDKGEGSDVVGKCIWTGHILEPHLPSVTNSMLNAIVFTCLNVTNYSDTSKKYNNVTPNDIWKWRTIEIVHETAHLFGAVDGYCEGVLEGEEHCSNLNCYRCNKEPIPECIMAKEVDPNDTTDVFCDECKQTIRNHLESHH